MKRGGSKMGYTAQFNLLSPCYKDGEQPAGFHMGGVKAKPTKKGKPTKKTKSKQRGGSTCYASPSVSEMGVVDKPASNQPTASELAWDNRMKGGANKNNIFSNTSPVGNNKTILPVGNNKTILPVGNNKTILSVGNNKTILSVGNNKNSPLNKIKNDLLPKETISGLAMTLIKTSKNKNTNSRNDTYSFEIFYKPNENTEIQKSVNSNAKFSDFLQEYRRITGEVFPPPPKPNAQTKVNINANATAKANGTVKATTNLGLGF